MAKRYRRGGRKRRRSRRTTRRRSKKRFKSRRKGRSKLADKRINTLVERRMSQIAAKQIAVQHRPDYKYVRGLWESAQADPQWGTYYGADVWPPADSFGEILPGPNGFFVREFAQCGGYLENLISTQMVNPGGMEPRDMFVHIKSLQSDFRFTNAHNKTVLVDMQITRFGYDKSLAYFSQAPTDVLVPGPQYIDHPPFTSPNTLNGQFKRAYKEPTPALPKRRFQVLARKRILLRPTRMIDDPDGAANAQRLNTIQYHSLKLNKFYKKKGQKEAYKILTTAQPGPLAPVLRGSLLHHRYFLSIRVTETVGFVGVTSVKFCAGSMLDKQMIFDRLAAGLNPGG